MDQPDAFGFQNFFTNFLQGAKKSGEKYPSRECTDEYYKMDHKNMGMALIFNQIDFSAHKGLKNREGTEKDVNDLKGTLELFGFDVYPHIDLSVSEILEVLQDTQKMDHSENNCLLIAMMSHGDRGGWIYANDGRMKVDDLWKNFNADKCSSLAGKPKIILVQACRGSLPDIGAEIKVTSLASKTTNSLPSKYVIPSVSDFIIYFSSVEGFPSFRDENGSWFVQAICATFRECHESQNETDVTKLFLRINRFIAYARQANIDNEYNACKQMPVIESMLTKIILFNKK